MRKSPSTNAPVSSMKKQRSASPSQAMPRSAPRLAHALDDQLAVLRQQRVGLVVGEVAVGRPVGLDQLELEALEQRPDHRAGHAVAAVENDLQRARRRGDRLRGRRSAARPSGTPRRGRPPRACRAPCRRRGRAGASGARLRRAGARPGCPSRPTARSRPRARAWRRCRPSGCARRCTSARRRARASRRGSRASRCRPGRRRSRSRSGVEQPVAVARRELGRGQAHVAPEADAQLADRLAGETREHAARRRARSARRRRRRSARRRGRGCRRP